MALQDADESKGRETGGTGTRTAGRTPDGRRGRATERRGAAVPEAGGGTRPRTDDGSRTDAVAGTPGAADAAGTPGAAAGTAGATPTTGEATEDSGAADAPAADPKIAAAVAAAEAAAPANGETVRIDSWVWAVRLVKTRSQGATACRGGHVHVNGERVKPAHSVRIGDEVRLRHEGRERIVVVKRLIRKRVGAPVAAQCYIDNSPPPPPREATAPIGVRDRGTGRPTKRDRRELERLRGAGGAGGSGNPGNRPKGR